MNKHLFIPCTLIAATCFTTSCIFNKKNNSNGEGNDSTLTMNDSLAHALADTVPIKLLTLQKNVPLIQNQKLPASQIDMNIFYPDYYKNDQLSNKLQQLFSKSVFGEELGLFSFIEAKKIFLEKYINNYLSLRKDYKKEIVRSGDKNVVWMNYEYFCNTAIDLNRENLFGYNVTTYTFTGGAHGMTTTTFHVIDLEQMKQLTTADIFFSTAEKKIAELLREQLKIDRKATINQLSNDGFELTAITPTENFYVTENKIIWMFNQYEIAPYSMGAIKIGLTFEQLKPYMLPENPIDRIIKK